MKHIRILNILPDIYTDGLAADIADREALAAQLAEDTGGMVELETHCVERGSELIECAYDAALAIPAVLEMAEQAQEAGYDAITLDCFMDPGLGECREKLTIPTFGVCQSSCSLAMRLAGEFSVISPADAVDRTIRESLRKYGMIDSLASIPVVDLAVLDYRGDIEGAVAPIIDAAEQAVRCDKAKAFVYGCTCLGALVEPLHEGLLERGIDVPVIDPMKATLYDAISCCLQGVAHSKMAYQPVRPKRRLLG